MGASMGFLAGLAGYLVKYVIFIAVAIGGIICGKKLRIAKDAKKAEEKQG